MAVETPRRGGAADRGGRGAAAGASGRGRGQAQGAAGVARLEGTPDAEADAACRRPVSFLRMIHHSKLPDELFSKADGLGCPLRPLLLA